MALVEFTLSQKSHAPIKIFLFLPQKLRACSHYRFCRRFSSGAGTRRSRDFTAAANNREDIAACSPRAQAAGKNVSVNKLSQ